ncbi:hypothetical protein SPRG_06023 [Saprolegnia parasitica CBS 223.65]|uniref:F-box/LRR-repeat protein 15-like leucin rich repeat domain-containing protein n=1 Tax=Saprolegnia parasitica (strain CBS 223.65) TaxID=695850 RepID=A0A067CFE2_SAPPC|nr:hypothetical protein SPRG_06023 [Saprolegnia parasitica CBS 223.65]KDO29484.1 hypothetical protein SPRG_06023 [Saprolegnia parasitica CBS 223.65]|eukprot:XP_012199980.1 hypothetical protein SPRG_06023 [Saprolegnia parasitica CBS 223.65]
MSLQASCLLALADLLTSGATDVDAYAAATSSLPVHLRHGLWCLLKAKDTCSRTVLAAVLSDEFEDVHVTGYRGDLAAFIDAWRDANVGCSVATLTLSSLPWSDGDLYVLLDALPQLRLLDTAYVNALHDEHVRSVVASAPTLCELRLSWCPLLTDAALGHIVAHVSQTLQVLFIPGTAVTTHGVLALAACKQLQQLNLQACDRVHGLPLGLGRLTHLDVRGLSCVPTETLMAVLKPIWPQLRHVSLGESSLSASAWTQLVAATRTRHDHITQLDLSWCFQLDAKALALSLPAFSQLHVLKLRCLDLDDDVLFAIATTCSNLRKLNLARCRNMTDDGLQCIASRCSQLQVVDLSWSIVSDATVHTMLSHSKFLQRLSLQGCKALHGAFLDAMCADKIAQRLTHLDLSWVNGVATERVQALLPQLPALEVLGYYGERILH